MSESFDPYHKWLGISPKDQPPDHYRLLGLEQFESDHDVIDAGANRVMSYLQHLAAGSHARACQKLLNEISAARLCLLDDKQRAAYDEKLRADQAKTEQRTRRAVRSRPPKPPAPPPVPRQGPAPSPPAVPAPAPAPPAPTSSPGSYAERRHGAYQARRQRKPWGLVAGLAVVTVAVVGVGIWVLGGGFRPQRPTEAQPDAAQNVTQGNGAAGNLVSSPPPRGASGSSDSSAGGTSGSETEPPPGAVTPAPVPSETPPTVPSETPPTIPSDPAPTDLTVEAELAALLAKAETALTEKRVPEGIELLEEYLADPAAPQLAKARQLLDHARSAVSDERALAILRQMNAAQLDRIAQGTLRVNLRDFQFNPPALLDVFQDTLRRNVDKARQLLAASTPTEPDKPGPTPPVTPLPSFDPVTQPAEFLGSKGLAAQGAFWLLAAEADSADRLEKLNALEKTFRAAAKARDDEFKQLGVMRQQLAAAEQQYKQYQQARKQPPPTLVGFLQQWRPKLGTPEAVAEIPEVKQVLAGHLAAYDPLLLALLREKPHFDGVRDRYQQLADDPQVAEALRNVKASPRQRLGPSKPFQRALDRFGKLEPLVLSDRVPATRSGQSFQIHLVVNETVPVDILYRPEFKFDNASVAAMFTDAVLKAAKVEVRPPYNNNLMIGNQKGQAKLVTVPSIRFGKYVLRDVKAFALSPESGALGSQIGAELFDDYKTELNGEEFYFKLEPRNLPAP